ncbi:hypothetical protein FSARC_9084 [Fusarium sarcochroum]|uniref:IBR domain-containing protein n=1 Tax=Fusarium sarcochroum TaxID=1208366 RepID=A0A8H4TRK8_9HYPO|nr:hypothetical protein FSARC_9084 [Fusarium sarcochroum]
MADESKHPTLSITLTISPLKFTRRAESPPSISITAILHADEPITIFTWHTIFNLKLAQRRKNFVCTDLTTSSRVELATTKGPKRSAFSSELGGPDDEYYCTFEPETPVTFKHRFLRSHALEGEQAFTPGHAYCLEVREDEEVSWWRYGKKEDVMSPPGQFYSRGGCEKASGRPVSANELDDSARIILMQGPDDNLAVTRRNGDTEILSMATSKKAQHFPYDASLELRQVEFGPDNNFASVSSTGLVLIWDTVSGDCMRQFDAYDDDPDDDSLQNWPPVMAFGPSGQIISVAKSVKIWSIYTDAHLDMSYSYEAAVSRRVAFSIDGRIAMNSSSSQVSIWQPGSGKTRQLLLNVSSVSDLSFNAWLLAVLSYNTVELWNSEDGTLVQKYHVPDFVVNLNFDPRSGSLLNTEYGTMYLDFKSYGCSIDTETDAAPIWWPESLRYTMDASSLMLALELQRQDLNLWEQSRKGKQRAGELTDSDLAVEACRHELEAVTLQVSDHTLASSIARAVQSDADIVRELQVAEEQAVSDREYAERLSTDPKARATPAPAAAKNHNFEQFVGETDEDSIDILKTMNLGGLDDAGLGQAESSSWASSRKPSQTRECVACNDRFPPLALSRSPCSHEYCRGCLIGLVRSSLQDESLFPPRCCGQPIPVKQDRWFSPELVGQFQAKKLEFDTPNRTYCSKPPCSTFVPPTFIAGDVATCPRCSRRTCIHCKAPYHTGVCQSDTAAQQILQLAAENGWQRCYACHRVVELDIGCYHMRLNSAIFAVSAGRNMLAHNGKKGDLSEEPKTSWTETIVHAA